MLVKVFGSAVYGVDARTITIEVDTTPGLFGLDLVGLPDSAVRESWQRVTGAIKNSGFRVPRVRTVINMSPADIRKEGSAYDLPIAIGLLGASGQINITQLHTFVMMGELSLDGSVLPIKGALPISIQTRKEGFETLIVPAENAREAAIVDRINVYGIKHLNDAIELVEGRPPFDPTTVDTREAFAHSSTLYETDFSDVRGQENIKRALEISAAGGHNVILIGPPGAGKTMLAKRLPSILPPMNLFEALETTKIHSVAGILQKDMGLVATRPFRAPHHTVSDVALVGGGSIPQPGEISLAHNGVLFLDELPEFKRTVLEVLRQPLEEREVTISRAKVSTTYPSSFMLIASMNPCPCGYYNHPDKACVCGPGVVQRYLNKVSGPLLDRIDIHVEVIPVEFSQLSGGKSAMTSEHIRKRVIEARDRQTERFANMPGIYSNAMMSSSLVREICIIDVAGQTLLKRAMERLNLSARAYDRILKVARTVADLSGSADIRNQDLAEAIGFRSLDRENWAG